LSSGPQSAVGYAWIINPLGASPKRLDCNHLYQMEIQRHKAEIQLLQIGLQWGAFVHRILPNGLSRP
jgi:hypothetical protein